MLDKAIWDNAEEKKRPFGNAEQITGIQDVINSKRGKAPNRLNSSKCGGDLFQWESYCISNSWKTHINGN